MTTRDVIPHYGCSQTAIHTDCRHSLYKKCFFRLKAPPPPESSLIRKSRWEAIKIIINNGIGFNHASSSVLLSLKPIIIHSYHFRFGSGGNCIVTGSHHQSVNTANLIESSARGYNLSIYDISITAIQRN